MEATSTIRKRSNFSKIGKYLKEVSAVKYNFPSSFCADGSKFKARISSIYDLENGLIRIFRPELFKKITFTEHKKLEAIPKISQLFGMKIRSSIKSSQLLRAIRIPNESAEEDVIKILFVDIGKSLQIVGEKCLELCFELTEEMKANPASSFLCRVDKIILCCEGTVPEFLKSHLNMEFQFKVVKYEESRFLVNGITHVEMLNLNHMRHHSSPMSLPPINKISRKVFLLIVDRINENFEMFGHSIEIPIFDETAKDRVNLMLEINEDFQNSRLKDLEKIPKPGEIVLARCSEKGSYFRARVLAVSSDRCEVFFVDYGDTRTVDLKFLKKLDKKYSDLPFQAFKFDVENVNPANCGAKQRELLKNYFSNEKFFWAELRNATNDSEKVTLRLFDKFGFDVAQLLTEFGLCGPGK